MDSFVTWCQQNHLQLYMMKTKELIVDFRRSKTPVTPISFQGGQCGWEDYQYLRVHIVNKLDTTGLYTKALNRLCFLRLLRSCNIYRTMMRIFYEFVLANAILYAVGCWGSRLRVVYANRLKKLICKSQ